MNSDLRKPVESLQLFEETLTLAKKKYGPEHFLTVDAMHNVAVVYGDLGRHAEAQTLFEEALAGRRRALPADSQQVVTTLMALSDCLLKQEKYVEAEPVVRNALAICEKKHPRHSSCFRLQCWLGAALAGQGKYSEAEPLLVTGYEQLKACENQLPAAAKNEPAEAVRYLIRLYEEWSKPEQAAEWRKKSTHPE